MSPVWGISFWNGKFAVWCGALIIGVGNCIRSGEFVIGVGIFLLVWAIVVPVWGVCL